MGWLDLEYRKDPRECPERREPEGEDCLDEQLFIAIHNNLYHLKLEVEKIKRAMSPGQLSLFNGGEDETI